MLKQFSFRNCYSFKDRTELSMEAVYAMKDHADFVRSTNNDGTGERLLPVAAIYGANAGGKSNVICALLDCASNICGRPTNTDRFFETGPLKNRLFALSKEPKETFEHGLILIIEGFEYNYNYKATNDLVLSEHLKQRKVCTSKWEDILIRDGETATFKGDSDHKSLVEDLALKRKDTLIANLAGVIGMEPFASIFKWCESALFVTQILSERERDVNLARLAAWAKVDPKRLSRLSKYISLFDNSIRRVEVLDLGNKSEDNPKEDRHHLILNHIIGDTNAFFLNRWESAGTRKLLELYLPLFNALEYGRPLVCDELDIMLHPLVFQRLVAMFNDPQENPKGAQLIFAAHNTVIMDREHLRRDEIHIVDKDKNGVSTICRISEYEDAEGKKIRMDARFEKLYLDGLLGATHDDFFQARV